MNEKEIVKRFKEIEMRLLNLEGRNKKHLEEESKEEEFSFNFSNKKLSHNNLLAELLKSEECHSSGGVTREDILRVFKQNGRPVVKKKINDLLNTWKKRKKIEAIKEGGNLKYFWIENETNTSK